MICKKCNKEIEKGERAIEVSYGKVYKTIHSLEIVGDRWEYYHTKCYEKRED